MKLRMILAEGRYILAAAIIAGLTAHADVQTPTTSIPASSPRFVRPTTPRIPPLEPSQWTETDREVLGPHARGDQTGELCEDVSPEH